MLQSSLLFFVVGGGFLNLLSLKERSNTNKKNQFWRLAKSGYREFRRFNPWFNPLFLICIREFLWVCHTDQIVQCRIHSRRVHTCAWISFLSSWIPLNILLPIWSQSVITLPPYVRHQCSLITPLHCSSWAFHYLIWFCAPSAHAK